MAIQPNNEFIDIEIREVWNDNLEDEFALIMNIVDDYPYIGMDTEFPGFVFGSSRSTNNYQGLKANVDVLKLIQLGLTFSDHQGNLPPCGTDDKQCLWQFNFREFNLDKDRYAKESIQLLRDSGIDFDRNHERGVDAFRFTDILMSSGIVLNHNVQFLTFHSAYDFGYLLKLLTWKKLPNTQAEFLNLLKMYFPVFYDIKYMIRFNNDLHGGLTAVAKTLGVERIGVRHQAGSDSYVTCKTFFALKEKYFGGSPEKQAGLLYGYSV